VSAVLPRVVLAAAAVALVVAVVVTLQRDSSRVLGYNGVPPATFAVSVPPGEEACQGMPPAPPATRAIRMTVGVNGDARARLRASVDGDGGTAVAVRDGRAELPIAGAANTQRLCVANEGGRRVELAGVTTAPAAAARVDDAPAGGVIAVQYLAGSARTWGERTGNVLARVGYAKGMVGGGATGALLIALLVLTVGGALALSWRYLRP
jgi:hypothetical protein